MVCNACYNSNWDGIVPDTYPHLASRIDWAVLERSRARRFYEGLGAVWIDKWLTYRLTGDALAAFGGEEAA
jgi:hypothetical protein